MPADVGGHRARFAPDAVILTLDAALEGCGAGLVAAGMVRAEMRHDVGRGGAAMLPALAARAMQAAGIAPGQLSAVAVTVGPGSFTGVRAALALAQGIALAAGVPVLGVTVGDAIRAAWPGPRPVWVAVDSRRGRVFLDAAGFILAPAIVALAIEDVPAPGGPVAVAGDAAPRVAARLLARGFDVQLLSIARPGPGGIAAAALSAPRPATPLYVDPPEARPGAAARPAPLDA